MNEAQKAAKILEKPLAEAGYSLYDIRFKSGKEATLEVVVDRLEPIGLDDIISLSEKLSSALDAEDPIEGAYTLDVSSAGAEKKIALSALPSYLGQFVHLHLSHPVKGENILEGTLISCGEQTTLQIKNKTRKEDWVFPTQDIDEARLAIEF